MVAPLYLLRVNEGTAIVGGSTIVHTHPRAEAFYVLTGEVSIRTPEGVMRVEAGQAMAGHAPGTIMQVYNSGSTELHELVMFVVDATQPFSSPAEFIVEESQARKTGSWQSSNWLNNSDDFTCQEGKPG